MRLVLLAAGASRRMAGRDKLLEVVDGVALLRRQALAALASGVGPVAVTLPVAQAARGAALAGLPVTLLAVSEAAEGMSASLREAANWAKGEALMVCPADMPEITAEDFATMARAYEGAPLRGTDDDGMSGHPVVFPPELLAQVARLTGDEGARSVLRAHPPRAVPLPDRHATTDLDTPQEWAVWRALRSGPSTA